MAIVEKQRGTVKPGCDATVIPRSKRRDIPLHSRSLPSTQMQWKLSDGYGNVEVLFLRERRLVGPFSVLRRERDIGVLMVVTLRWIDL